MKRREKEGWWNKECRELKEKVGEELRKWKDRRGQGSAYWDMRRKYKSV